MGMAIWLYLWCLDKITREEDDVGYVLGGAPVKVELIVGELGRSDRAIRRDLKALRGRYLQLRWTPYGYVIHVLNSRKFNIWSLAKNGKANRRNGEPGGKSGEARTENGRSKEDAAVAAVDTAEKQLQKPAAPNPQKEIWSFLGIDPCGPISFRVLLESRWASKNGDRASVVIGDTVDAWETAEGQKLRRCAPMFRALATLRDRERCEHNEPAADTQHVHKIQPEEIPA